VCPVIEICVVWGEGGGLYRVLGRGNLREIDHWGDPDVDGRIKLRGIFRKWKGVMGTGLCKTWRLKSTLYESLKKNKIKNHSDMFRILRDPSSGSKELCLTGITGSSSQIFYWLSFDVYNPNSSSQQAEPYRQTDTHTHTHTYTHTHTLQVQNYAAKHRPSTPQNICASLRIIPVKHSSVLPDDGSHRIRNMLE
jgi:hypothetical protein